MTIINIQAVHWVMLLNEDIEYCYIDQNRHLVVSCANYHKTSDSFLMCFFFSQTRARPEHWESPHSSPSKPRSIIIKHSSSAMEQKVFQIKLQILKPHHGHFIEAVLNRVCLSVCPLSSPPLQSTSPQRHPVKSRSKSTEEIQQAKKVNNIQPLAQTDRTLLGLLYRCTER